MRTVVLLLPLLIVLLTSCRQAVTDLAKPAGGTSSTSTSPPFTSEASSSSTSSDLTSVALAQALAQPNPAVIPLQVLQLITPKLFGVTSNGYVPPTAEWHSIPGLSVKLEAKRAADLVLNLTGHARTIPEVTEGCLVAYRFVIDDVVQGDAEWGQTVSQVAASHDGGRALTAYYQLTAGLHIIRVDAKVDKNYCYVCAEHSGQMTEYTHCRLTGVMTHVFDRGV